MVTMFGTSPLHQHAAVSNMSSGMLEYEQPQQPSMGYGGVGFGLNGGGAGMMSMMGTPLVGPSGNGYGSGGHHGTQGRTQAIPGMGGMCGMNGIGGLNGMGGMSGMTGMSMGPQGMGQMGMGQMGSGQMAMGGMGGGMGGMPGAGQMGMSGAMGFVSAPLVLPLCSYPGVPLCIALRASHRTPHCKR